MASPHTPSVPAAPGSETPAVLMPRGALSAEESHDRLVNMILIAVVSVGFLLGVGAWAYQRVGDSLRELRSAGLNAMLQAETRLVTNWIEEKKRDAERWASMPAVSAASSAIAAMAAHGVKPAQICSSAAQRELSETIAPYAQYEEIAAFNLISRDGTILASSHPALCGRRVASAEFVTVLAPAFSGRTVFIRPWPEADRVGGVEGSTLSGLLTWVETPVNGPGGETVAALGFGRQAETGFGKLLALRMGDSSREAYAFGVRGSMLSESRYEADLRATGLLPREGATLGRLAVRDPGGDLLAGFRPATPAADWPFTELARRAIEGLQKEGVTSGMLLDPYRNYRGTEVIGAWQWLPQKELAIAVEIDAKEAYAPLEELRRALELVLGFITVAVLLAVATSLWAIAQRLREARRVGQYELVREIGEGGMSNVYLARHARLKRPTAVKVLKTFMATDEIVARFEREAQLCSQLTHPNTIDIYDYGRTRDGRFYYAMEFLRGISLEELVPKDGPMPTSRAAHLLLQACGSLREAHARGIVHRDVKPHNLMACVHGGQYDVLKVLDFGLVKVVNDPRTRDITQFAKVLGTPLYMAPERLRNPADADARADIYALGAVAFFLVTGRPVFEAPSDHELVYQVLNVPAPSVRERGGADVPEIAVALIARCLEKDREARPQSIEEVAAILAEIARQRPWREEDARAWWHGRAAALGIDWEGATGNVAR